MRVYGRNLLDNHGIEIELGMIDEIVFDFGKNRSVRVSLYRARESGVLDIRSPDHGLVVYPDASNCIHIRPERR